ncbi:SPT2-like protein [Heterocephalus glaber]|uniref:SPT2-like protein n=1 Tax=Heterocephalus glaber TaxID=10181 RepID=G5BJ24_HETGA|nr:SPT2-like protein [Heterocephalus glaber]
MFSPHLVLALCPGTRTAAPAHDRSDQSVGLRRYPVTQFPLGGQSVMQVALGNLQAVQVALGNPSVAQIFLEDLWAALEALGSLYAVHMIDGLPKCTVVSEMISSKNIITKSSKGLMNRTKPSLSGYRSSQRLPFPAGYKRQRDYEEEEDGDNDE